MASCPAPLIWKKILFWRLSWISLSSIRRDVSMFRYARSRSSRDRPSNWSACGGAISVAIARRLPENGVPVRMRHAILDDPPAEELAVGARRDALLREEGLEGGVQGGKAVEGNGRKVMVLEVEVRPEVDELPERRARHPRAPLRGLFGHDVVVLPEAVEGERGREDEQDRNGVQPQESRGAAEKADRRGGEEVQADGGESLAANPPLERFRVRRGFDARGAEIDREERGRRIEELEPSRVLLRREVRALRVVREGTELGVVIEMPARELRRRDPRGQRVEEAEDAIGARPVAVEYGLVDDFVKEDRSVEDDEPENERARDPDPHALEAPAERERAREEDELAEGDREVAGGALAVELLQDLVCDGGPEPLPKVA